MEALGRTSSNKLSINEQTSFGACPENLTLQVTLIRADFRGEKKFTSCILKLILTEAYSSIFSDNLSICIEKHLTATDKQMLLFFG